MQYRWTYPYLGNRQKWISQTTDIEKGMRTRYPNHWSTTWINYCFRVSTVFYDAEARWPTQMILLACLVCQRSHSSCFLGHGCELIIVSYLSCPFEIRWSTKIRPDLLQGKWPHCFLASYSLIYRLPTSSSIYMFFICYSDSRRCYFPFFF